ncbi:MAG: DinB family protein [Bryobacterales bacterium]
MKRFPSCLVLVLFCTTTLVSSSYAQNTDSKGKIEALLKQSAKEFLAVIDNVSAEQWNFRAGNIRHSIGEEAEHVCFSEQELQKVLQAALKVNDPKKTAELKGKEEEVRELMLGAEKGAENFRPRGRINSKLEVLEYFNAAHNKLLQLLAGAQGLDSGYYKHPNKDYGELTTRQWFYYIAYHKQRHVKQIEAIKAHPDYPGRVRKASLDLPTSQAEPLALSSARP